MIHGMWSRGWVWDEFRKPFEQAGYTVHAPTLRHHELGVVEAALGRTGLRDYVEDLAAFIATLPCKPVLVGHSMGGLLAQLLAARGLAESAILICSAPPRGVFPVRPVMLPGTARIFMRPGFWNRPIRLSPWEARYAVYNRLPRAAADDQIARLVWESGRAAGEIVFAFAQPGGAAALDYNAHATPLLSLAASDDRIVPPAVCRENARRYGARCSYREYRGHGHWLIGEPGWEQVAEDCLRWCGAHHSVRRLRRIASADLAVQHATVAAASLETHALMPSLSRPNSQTPKPPPSLARACSAGRSPGTAPKRARMLLSTTSLRTRLIAAVSRTITTQGSI
jgi:pimeloyl-ACP methyl ester carboxylesterase